MSSNIIALPSHSHDATKGNQSTNIINNDKNTISSDRTLTHINDGQKKRGRKTRKHRCLEAAKPTKETPFDAKAILPESEALKSISKLLESMKKVVRFPDLRPTFGPLLTLTNSLIRGPSP